MHFSLVATVAALSLTASASVFVRQAGLPSCAVQCITGADLGGCDVADDSCLCRSQAFLNSSITCIGQSCKGQDLEDAVKDAQTLCAVAGVTLTSTPPGFPSVTGISIPAPSSTSPSSAASNSTSSAGAAAPTGSSAASVNTISTVAGIAALGLAALAL